MGDLTTWFEQAGYQVRFDWGQDGAARAGARGDVVVIVDTLRFSTTVAAHLAAGATVEPRYWKDGADTSLLSPTALLPITGGGERGEPIALASPNGAMCCRAASALGAKAVFAGALVNASTVAAAARALQTPITVIACGELSSPLSPLLPLSGGGAGGGGLRFALEDLLGAGAIIAALPHLSSSPEAKTARAAFLGAKPKLLTRLLTCGSGIELRDKGLEADVHYAAQLNSLAVAPCLTDGIFSNTTPPDDRTLS
ncbi:2-phosphosulfolactate phosphatase [Armatimonas sp.]|uniref:2-phosphosulfolactate phosphatase n=1 Tax=Armatimonas sp. TaxID=1872638 RepID=UPI00286A6368|nr:2-phosphosulfolactate phosphatase [Armatimonas sp.]